MSVFVAIASYADPDTAATVRSIARAAGMPVRFGVCLQDDGDAIAADLRALYLEGLAVDVLHVPARASRGLGWARLLAATLWDGETWTLTVDAHMRFLTGWADKLAAQSAMAGERAVLTTYAPDTGMAVQPTSLQLESWEHLERPLYHGAVDYSGRGRPIPARMLGGHFIWAPAAWALDVPQDPWLYYGCEEMGLAVRTWTAGWDLWHPGVAVCVHDFSRDGRPLHWEEHDDWGNALEVGRSRARALLTGADSGLGAWGLGSARTLAEYQAWAGVDILNRTWTPDAEWRAGLA